MTQKTYLHLTIWAAFALFAEGAITYGQAAGTPGAKTRGAQSTGSVTQSWTGTLFDSLQTGCGGAAKGSAPTDTCPVSVCTINFSIRLPDGMLYKFDEDGNAKSR